MANAKELAKFVRSSIPTIHSKVPYYALTAKNLFMRLHRRLVQEVNHHAISAPPQCKGKYKSIKTDTMHDDFKEMLQRIKPDDRLLALYKEVLIAEAANQLGSLNGKISKARNQLDTIAENRLNAIKKFNADQLTIDEKTELVNAYDDDKVTIADELRQLERQQTIRETDIDVALEIMRDVIDSGY